MATKMVRAIIEIPEDALASDDADGMRDEITDELIDAFDSPLIAVLDLVREDDGSAWLRSEHF